MLTDVSASKLFYLIHKGPISREYRKEAEDE